MTFVYSCGIIIKSVQVIYVKEWRTRVCNKYVHGERKKKERREAC